MNPLADKYLKQIDGETGGLSLTEHIAFLEALIAGLKHQLNESEYALAEKQEGMA